MTTRALVCLALATCLACRTDPVATNTAPTPLPPVAVTSTISERAALDTAIAEAAPPPSESAPPPAPAPTSRALAAAGCQTNADCVLSATPVDCCACDLDHEQPVLARALTQRNARCATADCKMPTCGKTERYDPAFERAECRAGTCVVVRWHSGG